MFSRSGRNDATFERSRSVAISIASVLSTSCCRGCMLRVAECLLRQDCVDRAVVDKAVETLRVGIPIAADPQPFFGILSYAYVSDLNRRQERTEEWPWNTPHTSMSNGVGSLTARR